MKVNVFLSVYNARVKHMGNITPQDVLGIIGDLIKPISFIPFDDKMKIIDGVINETKNSNHPTADRYRLLIVNLISAYTQLECGIKDYDTLVQSKMIDPIINLFETEYVYCHNLMQMCISDIRSGDYVFKSG